MRTINIKETEYNKVNPQLFNNEIENEFDEILEEAIEHEKEEYLLYLNLGKKVKNRNAKKAFLKLAEEELSHAKLLEHFLDKGENSFQIPNNYETIDESIETTNIHLNSNTDIKEVLLFAIKKEREAYERYKALARQSLSERVRDTFVKLSRLELGHAKRLENIYKNNYKEYLH